MILAAETEDLFPLHPPGGPSVANHALLHDNARCPRVAKVPTAGCVETLQTSDWPPEGQTRRIGVEKWSWLRVLSAHPPLQCDLQPSLQDAFTRLRQSLQAFILATATSRLDPPRALGDCQVCIGGEPGRHPTAAQPLRAHSIVCQRQWTKRVVRCGQRLHRVLEFFQQHDERARGREKGSPAASSPLLARARAVHGRRQRCGRRCDA